jgi:hypothetical protein
MSRIEQLKAQLFAPVVFVAGGHGGWSRPDGKTMIPVGMTLYFYYKHTKYSSQ